MPTKRTRRSRRRRQPISPGAWAWLTDAPMPSNVDQNDDFEISLFFLDPQDLRDLWETHRDEVLANWVRENPGTRPARWWEFDAPRSPSGTYTGRYFDGKLPDPRRRIGGTGTPCHEVMAHVPRFEFGIPMDWVDPWSVEYYNGRAKDIHGNPIGTEYHDGYFRGVAYDPEDPPTFESQAAYLDRHGLLTAEERKAIGPEAFAAEPLVEDFD